MRLFVGYFVVGHFVGCFTVRPVCCRMFRSIVNCTLCIQEVRQNKIPSCRFFI
jgi:hypothetical protein